MQINSSIDVRPGRGSPCSGRQRSLLGVSFAGLAQLEGILGPDVLESVLGELAGCLDDVGKRVLSQHPYAKAVHGAGSWAAIFEVQTGILPRNTDELHRAIASATRALIDVAVLRIFGSGTGPRISYAVVVKPVPSDDEALTQYVHETLREISPAIFHKVGASDVGMALQLKNILEHRAIRTFLQPIVCMENGQVAGYEALSRGPKGTRLELPERLFSVARDCGRDVELELVCAALALERTRGRLAPGQFLTINLGPQALMLAADRLSLAGRSDVMLELTEHIPLDEVDALSIGVERLRDIGVGIVLDDAGCGYADLNTAEALLPDIVKLCITVTRQVGGAGSVDEAVGSAVRKLRALGCSVLAEGVETNAQRKTLSAWPIDYAQGFLFAAATESERVLSILAKRALLMTRSAPLLS